MKNSRNDLNDLSKGRGSRQTKKARLGGYLIVTDTSKTEANYFNSIWKSVQNSIQGEDDGLIKVCKDMKTEEMIAEAQKLRNESSRYREVWLIFDRDFVKNFDGMIREISKNDMHAGWSNPCFEIWLSAYFGEMSKEYNPKQCTQKFEKLLRRHCHINRYDKADPGLRDRLVKCGSETKAIAFAKKRYKEVCRQYSKPSEMIGSTTVYQLVEELLKKAGLLNLEKV